jgi:hypothetical protein
MTAKKEQKTAQGNAPEIRHAFKINVSLDGYGFQRTFSAIQGEERGLMTERYARDICSKLISKGLKVTLWRVTTETEILIG